MEYGGEWNGWGVPFLLLNEAIYRRVWVFSATRWGKTKMQ